MFIVNNVKISCKIIEISLSTIERICCRKKINYKLYHNFIVFRTKGFTYTLFKKKFDTDSLKDCKKLQQHVNITKCLFKNIPKALRRLADIISFDHTKLTYKIDTITASGSLGYFLDLEKIISEKLDDACKITYMPEKFPGLFISYQNKTLTHNE